MVDAQTWLKENYENKKNSKEIKVKEGTELKEELEIKDYPDLEAIFLPFTKEITKLTIVNCPKIEVIFVPGNKITKIEGLEALTQLRELNFGENQVEEIDVNNNNVLEDLSLHKNPKTFKFTGGFGSLKNLLKLVTWNSEDTLPIANILEGLSENDLKDVADKLGVKTENKPKEDIKKEIIAEIEKNNQNKEKLKDPKTGIPDLLNENGEIDKDKLGKLKDDAKKYEALVAEPKNDPVKSADKKDIDQGNLTKLIEDFEKFKGLLTKAGIDPTAPNAEKQAEDLKNTKEAVDKAGLDPTTNLGQQIDDLKKRPTKEDLNNAVKNAEDKYKDYINPNDLESKAKEKGMVSKGEYDKVVGERNARPNITLAEHERLKGNQERHTDYDAIKNELENWKKLGKTPEQVAKDIKDLQSRPATGGAVLSSDQQQKLNNYDKVKAQRDTRPNITLDQYNKIASFMRQKTGKRDWENQIFGTNWQAQIQQPDK